LSATLTLNSNIRLIKKAVQPTNIRPSSDKHPHRYVKLAQTANGLSSIVENRWEEIPDDHRILLADLAYTLVGEKDGDGTSKNIKSIFAHLATFLRVSYAIFSGEFEELRFFCASLDRLSDSILSKIESEAQDYNNSLSQSLKQTFEDIKSTESMTAEEACGRIRTLSNQVLSEI
jgi:hypothetical protein